MASRTKQREPRWFGGGLVAVASATAPYQRKPVSGSSSPKNKERELSERIKVAFDASHYPRAPPERRAGFIPLISPTKRISSEEIETFHELVWNLVIIAQVLLPRLGGGGEVTLHWKGPERRPDLVLTADRCLADHTRASRSASRGAQLAIAAGQCL
jgi:hypothetical protein